MQLFRKLNHFFGFTPTESRVIFFLLITFLAGGSIKLYRYYSPSSFAPNFDYSEDDREFAIRSKLIDSIEASRASVGRSTGDKIQGKERKKGSTPKKSKSIKAQSVIDLNTATKADLMNLPGIGEAMAERILIYREEKGGFREVEELKNIRGIGEKKLEKIRPWVKIK